MRHEHAVLVQWDGEEQSTLDSVLAKLPFSKHSALERYEVFPPCPMKKKQRERPNLIVLTPRTLSLFSSSFLHTLTKKTPATPAPRPSSPRRPSAM